MTAEDASKEDGSRRRRPRRGRARSRASRRLMSTWRAGSARQFGGGYDVGHSAPFWIVDKKGMIRVGMDAGATPADLVTNIRVLLKLSSAGVVGAAGQAPSSAASKMSIGRQSAHEDAPACFCVVPGRHRPHPCRTARAARNRRSRPGRRDNRPAAKVQRGSILDRKGRIMAITTRLQRVSVWIPSVTNAEETARQLAGVLGMMPTRCSALCAATTAMRSSSGGSHRKNRRRWRSSRRKGSSPGVKIEDDYRRFYPQGRHCIPCRGIRRRGRGGARRHRAHVQRRACLPAAQHGHGHRSSVTRSSSRSTWISSTSPTRSREMQCGRTRPTPWPSSSWTRTPGRSSPTPLCLTSIPTSSSRTRLRSTRMRSRIDRSPRRTSPDRYSRSSPFHHSWTWAPSRRRTGSMPRRV